MLLLHDEGKKITITKIAKSLQVSTRTIYRNITEGLKREKELLNNEKI
jgi:transcriptional antiterminator